MHQNRVRAEAGTLVGMSTVAPEADIVLEAQRLMDAARANDVPVRLIGGLAVRFHVGVDTEPIFTRVYKDIDLATLKGKSKDVSAMMLSMGYEPNKEFNAMNGHRRLLFYDMGNQRQVDVFVGSFEMCHQIPITERITLDGEGIPLAELLLTKLQIVQLNAKDQTDIITMLYHHDVTDDDAGHINAGRVAELCASDWGLWRTTRMNIERTQAAVPTSGLSPEDQTLVLDRLARLWQRIEDEPKSGKWKMRNRIGDKKRWYEEPDEVD
jgi:hypothetical protein